MKKYKLGLVGCGRAAYWHAQAIQTMSENFELLATYDINNNGLNLPDAKKCLTLDSLLEVKLDGVVVTVPSSQKLKVCTRILESGKNIIVEKPFVQTISEFKSLEKLANQQNLVMYGALHARFSSTLTSFVKNLNINEQGTSHLNHGQLKKIELRRFDPYVKDGIVTHAPEISSGLDSWPNIFSELDLYTSRYKIGSVQDFDSTFYPEYPEVKARVEGNIAGGSFTAYTDWTNNMNQKDTTLFFENGVVKLDHTNQQIWEGKDTSDLRMTADYNNLGSRLEVEYIGIYRELYMVLSGNIPDNRNLSRRLVIDVETLMNSLQTGSIRSMNS